MAGLAQHQKENSRMPDSFAQTPTAATLDWLQAPCPRPSSEHATRARQRQDQLTKPQGSLGRLEALAIQLAALQATDAPHAHHAPIIIFAGDHGITAQGVSAFPSAVTVQMLQNFAQGGAAIAVLARTLDVQLHVVDVGTLAATPISGVVTDKLRAGTRDFSLEPAMMRAELAHALAAGRRAVARATADAASVAILGEMGIGNTTSAAAIAAALLGEAPSNLVGAGTGLDANGQTHKAIVIADALRRHGLLTDAPDPLAVLAAVGGFEIAALAGAIVASAQAHVPVLIDGFIVTAAALVACRLNPSCRPYLIFAHRSQERGHTRVLEALAAEPLLDLGLRLGEASGAATALPLLRLACALHNGMATFAEAAVSDRAP
jgi:nicotinate-nucleotide--dimethylbenzimidazole phosphoribosyltransferase